MIDLLECSHNHKNEMTLITTTPRVETVKEPFSTYQAYPALNHSSLKISDIHGSGCPRKAWAELSSKWKTTPETVEADDDEESGDEDERATDAMRFGTLYHAFLLEPGSFRQSAAVLDGVMKARLYNEALADKSRAKGFSKSLGTYKRWKAECVASGLEVVDEKTVAKMEDMRETIWRDGEIQSELAGVQQTECSIYFGMPTGIDGQHVQCKARIDAWYPGVILDLKTCRSAHPLEFARQIPKMGYDTQMAWYKIAAKAVGMDVRRVGFVAQEATFPYCGALHWMPEDWMTYARKEVMRIYTEFARHCVAGSFPGYGNGEILPPAWLEETIEMNA